MELNIEAFDPNIADLRKMVEDTSKITEADDLQKVKEARIALGKVRITIAKKGKELREDALSFQRAVIDKEKELIGMIQPEELRLKGIEEAVEKKKERERRMALLPMRRDKVAGIDEMYSFTKAITDEELLSMDDEQFAAFYNQLVADKNERDRIALAAEKQKVEDEKAEIARQQEIKDAEEKARKEEQEKAQQVEKDRVAREAKELKERRIKLITMRGLVYSFTLNAYIDEATDKVAYTMQEIETMDDMAFADRLGIVDTVLTEVRLKREQEEKEEAEAKAKEEAEAAEKAEKERMEKQEAYKAFLREHGYTEENKDQFLIKREGNVVRLYKFVGEIDFYGVQQS